VLLKRIDLRTGLREVSEEGRRSSVEVTVTMKFMASPTEASVLGSLLLPGSSTPPRAFWDALDYGDVKPLVIGGPLTAGEVSDIRHAWAKASGPEHERIQSLFAACVEVMQQRWEPLDAS